MNTEKYSIIPYEGKQINLYSDERNDYICLTDMLNAWNSKGKGKKNVTNWIRNQQTIDFLDVWEKKFNPNYRYAQLSKAAQLIKERNFSIKQWVDLTNAKGIFTRFGDVSGTYAHKDIALKFASWLSPEFELFLVEEIQRLKELERQKDSYELLTHEQILHLVRLKEVFKFVAHQEIIEDAHKEVFAAKSNAKNPFAEFHVWRNKILDIAPNTIDERIKQYCIENNIALTKKLLRKPKSEKILMLDSYEAVRNAVWDFLRIKGEINALNLANLVRDIIRTEKGEVVRNNEDNLFQEKQNLGEYSDFKDKVAQLPEVKTAKQVLAHREEQKKMLKDPQAYNDTIDKLISNE